VARTYGRSVDRSTVVRALDAERAALVDAMRLLDERDHDRPTRCPPWTVRELLAHVLVAGRRLGPMLTDPPPPRAEHDAYDYFVRDHHGGDADAERIAAARALAATFPDGPALVAAVDAAWAATAEAARSAPADRLVRTRWDERMTVTDYATTRVVELAVHGLDLADGLGRAPWLTPPASALVAAVLARDLPTAARDALGWDDRTLVEKATGRTALTDAEAARGVAPHLLWPRR
jgi:uncharacterized protein (TIGR03083 family)